MVICKYYLRGNCRFGENCKNEHSFNTIGNSNSIVKKKLDVDIGILIKTASNDMEKAVKGSQWPLSCYGPFTGNPCFPGFEDKSFEEVRYAMYEADRNGTLEQYKQQLLQCIQEARMKMVSLQNPTPEAANVLKELYNTNSEQSFGTNSFSTQQTGSIFNSQESGRSIFSKSNNFSFSQPNNQINSGQSSIFGQTASVFGGGGQGSIFGAAQPQNIGGSYSNSVFGKSQLNQFGSQPSTQSPFSQSLSQPMFGQVAPNQSPFGAQQVATQSPFGAQQVSTQSPFGSATTQSPFGTQPVATSQSIFGAQPVVSTQSPFGTQPVVNTQSPFGTQMATTQSPFGIQQATTQSPFGNPNFETQPAITPSPFGNQQVPTQSPFGAQPTTIQSPFGGQPAPAFGALPTNPPPPPYGAQPNFGSGGSIFNQQSVQNPYQNTQNPFGGAASNTTSIFGATAPIVGQVAQPQNTHTSSIFNVVPEQKSIFGGGTISNRSLSANFSDQVYSKLEELLPEEIQSYEAAQFELGKIPINPPTREMCF